MAILQRLYKKGFVILSISFFGLSLLVHLGFLKEIDTKALLLFQAITPKSLDPFLSIFSLIGSFWIITGGFAALLLVGKKYRPLVWFLIITFLLHLVEIFGKHFIAQPLPPKEFVRTVLPFYPPYSSLKTSFAFPSGHSMRAVFAGLTGLFLVNSSKLSKNTKRFLKIFIFSFVFIMLYSRISLGEHWLSDVLGGVLLGIIGGSLLKALDSEIRQII